MMRYIFTGNRPMVREKYAFVSYSPHVFLSGGQYLILAS